MLISDDLLIIGFVEWKLQEGASSSTVLPLTWGPEIRAFAPLVV